MATGVPFSKLPVFAGLVAGDRLPLLRPTAKLSKDQNGTIDVNTLCYSPGQTDTLLAAKADLGADGKVLPAQLPAFTTNFAGLQGQPSDNPALATALAAKASLGSDGKVLPTQLPAIPKLYTALGTSTDGALDQNTASSALSTHTQQITSLLGRTAPYVVVGSDGTQRTYDTLSAALAAATTKYGTLRLNTPVTTSVTFPTLGTLRGGGNAVQGVSGSPFTLSASTIYDTPLSYGNVTANVIYNSTLNNSAISGLLLGCILGTGLTVPGSLTLGAGTQDNGFLATLTKQADGSYKTPEGGTVYDQRTNPNMGGRFRGAWAANTAYTQYDTALQAGILYYATNTFTSGTTFAAANWTVLDAVLTAAQVTALLATVQPVVGLTIDNTTKGYATLNAAVYDAKTTCFSLHLNILSTGVSQGVGQQTKSWPSYLFGGGARIAVFDGVTVLTSGSFRQNHYLENAYFTYPNGAATGTGLILLPSADGDVPAEVTAGRWVAVDSDVEVRLGSGAGLVLHNCHLATLNGPGSTVWLRGNSRIDNVGAGVTVYDLTSGGSGGSSGPSVEELQLFTADTNTRVVPLALTAALKLVSTSAIAARNVSAITFQVNTYQNGAWVAGTERTALADANADIVAIAAAQYAAGAELLFKITAIDTTKAARGIAVFSRA